jgi:hypothetical protein
MDNLGRDPNILNPLGFVDKNNFGASQQGFDLLGIGIGELLPNQGIISIQK